MPYTSITGSLEAQISQLIIRLARPPASNSRAHTRWVGVCTSVLSPKRGSVRTVRSVMPTWARADTALTRPNSGSSAVITYTPWSSSGPAPCSCTFIAPECSAQRNGPQD
ncbi:MAG: hypothetical protein OXP36_03305, partial [Gammaproteobacteria bacterium]|nr:hypothetical protein [Gammaproteobacteria bacterium]